MTKQEKIIVSAYTGISMCNFSDIHEYIEKKLNKPIWTHEFADPKLWEEIQEAVKADFLALCGDDQP